MEVWIEGLLWLSVTMIVLATVGYPFVLAVAAPLFGRRPRIDDAEPRVTLIIAAHNEECCLAAKLENALALEYPRDRLEIVVASDGSTDATVAIAACFRDRGVRLRCFPRTGKTGVQNLVARSAAGEILVFSDANALYRPNAIRKLVRNFADPSVACVSGQLTYQRAEGAGGCESSYWSYEKFLKRRESDLSSLIGANGSIYAVRRADYIEINNDLISDFVEPLALVRNGRRVVYEPEAVSVEEAGTTHAVEFRRKVRILTRSIRGLLHMRELLNPFRYGIFSIQLLMHKVLRYFVPLFLLSGLTSLTALALLGRHRALFTMAVISIGVACAVARRMDRRGSNVFVRVCHLLYYYLMVNYALVSAWHNIVRGAGMTLWVPERKGI